MKLENSFQVPVPVDEAWALFTDVHRIAPCMPGAEITEDLGEDRYRGQARVRLGPVTLRFAGEAELVEQDEATRTVRLVASGRDQTGRGNARAVVTSRLVADNGVTNVELVTDLQLSGAVAQFGRQGIVTDVSSGLIDQFAICLCQRLEPAAVQPGGQPRATTGPTAAGSISALGVLRQIVVGIARRAWQRLRSLSPRR